MLLVRLKNKLFETLERVFNAYLAHVGGMELDHEVTFVHAQNAVLVFRDE